MKTKVLNQNGEVIEEIKLNKNVFAITPNKQTIYDAVKVVNSNRRQATAKTKTRSEISVGAKKPWRQKGTGRARHGSTNSPIWVGGSKAHGRTGKENFKIKQNRKEARLALKSVLSTKFKNKSAIVIDEIKVESGKTKDMVEVLNKLKLEGKTLIVASENTTTLETLHSLSNLKNVALLLADKYEYEEDGEKRIYYDLGINVYDLLNANNIVFTKEAINNIEEVLSNGA